MDVKIIEYNNVGKCNMISKKVDSSNHKNYKKISMLFYHKSCPDYFYKILN